MKGNVIVDVDIFNLCSQILKLNDKISQLHSRNKKTKSGLAVVKNVNTKLEEWIINLEKNEAKSEQYSQCNNIEFYSILNDIPDDNLEKVVIDICHDSGLEIEPKDIEGCHCLPVSRYRRDSTKRVIVKFVNRKHPEALLWNKKYIEAFSHLNVHGKVFICFLCLYYWYIWGKCKDLQRRGKIYQVFCLGSTIAIKVTTHSSAMKIFRECDILDLDTDDVWKLKLF